MDHWEAHYLVKWEREAIVPKYQLSAASGADPSELNWLGKLWFEDED